MSTQAHTIGSDTGRIPRAMRIGPALLLGCAVLAGPQVGCRGDRSDNPPRRFFEDMKDAPRWNPQSQTDFFADGRTGRPPVDGTVPFGRAPVVSEDEWADAYNVERARFLRENDALYRGVEPGEDGDAYVAHIPADIEVTREMIERGRERYNINCASCHGYTGEGDGMVGRQWSAPLPSFHDSRFKDREDQSGKDGHIFHVIRNGVVQGGDVRMPAYRHAVSEHDAWAIVAYIRVLQQTREGSLEDVPEQQREVLERQRGAGGGGSARGAASDEPRGGDA